MKNISLKSIKTESIKKIFNSITSAEKISRAEISNLTDLSLMTVGKVVDALLDIKIITQVKETKNSVGRKVGLVSLNTEYFALIIDLSEKAFTLNLIDISLRLLDTFTYTYNHNIYYDENLIMFLKKVSAYIDSCVDKDKLIGIGITLPGTYIPEEDRVAASKIPELNTVNIKNTVEGIIGMEVSVITNNVKSAAISNIRSLKDHEDRVVIYMYMGECVDGSVYNRGSFVIGSHGAECDFGSMILRFGETLEERLRQSHSDRELADELTSAIYNIITILDPDTFIIESNLPRTHEYLIKEIKNSLSVMFRLREEKMPEFIMSGTELKHSSRGVVINLRDKWIDSII